MCNSNIGNHDEFNLNTIFQGFRVSELQGYRVTGLQGFRVAECFATKSFFISGLLFAICIEATGLQIAQFGCKVNYLPDDRPEMAIFAI
jgi:hypothetical protein